MSVFYIMRNWTERVTKGARFIDSDHAYIHEGYMFTAFTKQEIASSGVYKITFETPASATGKYIHWRPEFVSTSGDSVDIKVYEGSSGDSGGSDFTPINRNRLSSETSLSTVTLGATVTTNGTQIDQTFVGGGTGVGNTTQGSESGDKNEIMLKQGTLYTVEITNGSDSANNIFVKLLWYEENDA